MLVLIRFIDHRCDSGLNGPDRGRINVGHLLVLNFATNGAGAIFRIISKFLGVRSSFMNKVPFNHATSHAKVNTRIFLKVGVGRPTTKKVRCESFRDNERIYFCQLFCHVPVSFLNVRAS